MRIWEIEEDEECGMAHLKHRMRRIKSAAEGSSTVPSDDPIRQEKRLYPRVPCFLLVDYVAGGCAYRSFVKDLSVDGAFIESPRPFAADTELSLVISFLDDDHPVKLVGEVVRAGRQGIAVKFDHLAEHRTGLSLNPD